MLPQSDDCSSARTDPERQAPEQSNVSAERRGVLNNQRVSDGREPYEAPQEKQSDEDVIRARLGVVVLLMGLIAFVIVGSVLIPVYLAILYEVISPGLGTAILAGIWCVTWLAQRFDRRSDIRSGIANR
jgi:hypothetical protein